MTSKNHARCAAMLAIVSILAPPARGAGTTISWGASGGFHFCGSYSPPEPILSKTTQFVAQLIWSPDASQDMPQVGTGEPGGNDVLLDQVSLTISSGAGSTWGDFVGADYANTSTPPGYIYGRIVVTYGSSWHFYYDGAMLSFSNSPLSPPEMPLTYNFNTNAASSNMMAYDSCLSCLEQCPEPVLAIDQSDDMIIVTYQGIDANASYYLQVTHDPAANAWTNLSGSNGPGAAFAVTNQGEGALFRVNKKSRWD